MADDTILSDRIVVDMSRYSDTGNAFAILGACRKAAHRAGWSPERIAAVIDEATAGDYDHLLCVITDHFDLEV